MLLEGRVFASTLGQNFVGEFKNGGCVALFGDAVLEPLHKAAEVAKEVPETLEHLSMGVQGAGLAVGGAAGTALLSGGINLWSASETAARLAPEGLAGTGDIILASGLYQELSAMGSGNCQ